MGNQKTQKPVSHFIVSSFRNGLVWANYENKYLMRSLLFDSFHKQFCEKTVWFPLKFTLTSWNTTNLHFMSLLSRLYLNLAKLAQNHPCVPQAGMPSNLGLAHNTEFILWQNVALDKVYPEFRCISHKVWIQWMRPVLRTGQKQKYEIWFRVSLLSLDLSASLATDIYEKC